MGNLRILRIECKRSWLIKFHAVLSVNFLFSSSWQTKQMFESVPIAQACLLLENECGLPIR